MRIEKSDDYKKSDGNKDGDDTIEADRNKDSAFRTTMAGDQNNDAAR
jgi:hypothetical protein